MTSLQIQADFQQGWGSASRMAKRLIDLVGACVSLLLLSPLMLAIALLIRLASKGPALIREPRIGQGGIEFQARGFRTFGPSPSAFPEDEIEPLWADRIDDFLNRSGLERLPLLINVVRGEMSLVGPRPFTLSEARIVLREDSEIYSQRNSVPPGLIGPWQLQRRLGDDLQLMVNADLDYISRSSLLLDLNLLVRAFFSLILR